MKRQSLLIILFLFVFSFSAVFAVKPEIHGFGEFDFGGKLRSDTTEKDDYNLFEQRLQIKSSYFIEGENYFSDKGASLNLKADFIADEYTEKGEAEIRELNLSLTPFDFMDAKLGRQVLTWGTGDYLFINDMFPKDYISFFIGRDDEYLKKPSDALKVSLYPKVANIDLIVIPHFTPNTITEGDRLSFFDPFLGGIAGSNSVRYLIKPSTEFSNTEYAFRIYKNLGSNELAFYYFRGFDKNPRSYQNEAARQLYYEKLNVYGASIRGPFAKGIGNIEIGYNYSREDSNGDNRLIENSMFKTLFGYSKDLGNDMKIGFQYLYEQKLNYSNYLNNLLLGDYVFDEYRHLFTNRITKLYKNQTVRLSLFTFYSPSDKDGYVRPSASYDITDHWKLSFGGNFPWGEDDITEFGQMKKNRNIFIRVRYSF